MATISRARHGGGGDGGGQPMPPISGRVRPNTKAVFGGVFGLTIGMLLQLPLVFH